MPWLLCVSRTSSRTRSSFIASEDFAPEPGIARFARELIGSKKPQAEQASLRSWSREDWS